MWVLRKLGTLRGSDMFPARLSAIADHDLVEFAVRRKW